MMMMIIIIIIIIIMIVMMVTMMMVMIVMMAMKMLMMLMVMMMIIILLLLFNYVNVSMGAYGFIEKDSKSLFDLRRLKLPENEILFLTRRITNTCIRASYYIFCRRSKEWTSPELLTF